jgi:hypothetical protein
MIVFHVHVVVVLIEQGTSKLASFYLLCAHDGPLLWSEAIFKAIEDFAGVSPDVIPNGRLSFSCVC